MKETNSVILENGIEYIEVNNLINNNEKYVFLSNPNDFEDFCIRKIQLIDKEEYIVKLDDEHEYNLILKLFVEKNKALF